MELSGNYQENSGFMLQFLQDLIRFLSSADKSPDQGDQILRVKESQ
jgi:hypothetical protein